jgi:hypothetical protein
MNVFRLQCYFGTLMSVCILQQCAVACSGSLLHSCGFVVIMCFSSQWYTTSQNTVLVSVTSARILVPIQVLMMKTGLKEDDRGQLTW